MSRTTLALRHRDAILSGKTTLAQVAANAKSSEKYLDALWEMMTDKAPSHPLDTIRAKWRAGSEKDWPALTAEIAAWQSALWKHVRVGDYREERRQLPNDPAPADSRDVRIAVKPTPGREDVTIYLSARDHEAGAKGNVVWSRPRLEGPGKPTLLLSDYAKYGAAFEVDYPSVFANSAKYLSAVVEVTNDDLTIEGLGKKRGLDAALLRRWVEVLAIDQPVKEGKPGGRLVDVEPFHLFTDRSGVNTSMPRIQGWVRNHQTGMPQFLANHSDKVETASVRAAPRAIMVHPSPKEHVAGVWVAPVGAKVRVQARVTHVDHRGGSNGIVWRLEYRSGRRAWILGEGPIEPRGEVKPLARTFEVAKGDEIAPMVDSKDGDHTHDFADISLTITEIVAGDAPDKKPRVWDLAADYFIDTPHPEGNPHIDKYGNEGVWRYSYGPSRPLGRSMSTGIPTRSLLGKWHAATFDPARKDELAKLAEQIQDVLSGPRPAPENGADRLLYDNFVSADGVLFKGFDPAPHGKRPATAFGLPKERFGKPNGASLTVPPTP